MTHDVRVMMECALRGTSQIERNRVRPVSSVECDVELWCWLISGASGVRYPGFLVGSWTRPVARIRSVHVCVCENGATRDGWHCTAALMREYSRARSVLRRPAYNVHYYLATPRRARGAGRAARQTRSSTRTDGKRGNPWVGKENPLTHALSTWSQRPHCPH